MGEPGLEMMREAAEKFGLFSVSEVMDPSQVEMMGHYVDIYQVGARNMQNYHLLRALGEVRKPVLLKRGLSATMEELLLSAEYILAGGNYNVILCERGIRTYETYTRNTFDIAAIPVIKKLSHLPMWCDPSHGTGLIGGSFALALRKYTTDIRIAGWDRLETLREARALQVIDDAHHGDLAPALRGADVIYIALPIGATLDLLPDIARHAPGHAL